MLELMGVLLSVQVQVVKLVSSAVAQVDASQQAGVATALQTAQMILMRLAAVSNSHNYSSLKLQAVRLNWMSVCP